MKHMWSEEEIQELISEQGGSGGKLYLHKIRGTNNVIYMAFISTEQAPLTRLLELNDLIQNQKIIQAYYVGSAEELVHDVWCTALISYDSDISAKTLTYYNNNNNKWVNLNINDQGLQNDTVTPL